MSSARAVRARHRARSPLRLAAAAVAVAVVALVAVPVAGAGPSTGGTRVDGPSTARPPTARPPTVLGWPDARAANALLGRGVNVLVPWSWYPPGHQGIEPAVAAPLVRQGGFDSARFFVAFGHGAGDAPAYEIDPAVLSELRAALAPFLERSIPVSLTFDGGIVSAERFAAIWRQVAAALADLPPTVFFDLANEPLWNHAFGVPPDFSPANVVQPEQWNAVLPTAITAIRASNPLRTVIVPAAQLSFPQAVAALRLPAGDSHLLATFHQYQPLAVTHQGAAPYGTPLPTGVDWGSPADVEALRASMNDAVCWSRANDVPLYLSEFGVNLVAPPSAIVTWNRTVARLAEAEGVSWAYFELAGPGMGVYDVVAGAFRPGLHDALVPPPSTPSLAPWAVCPIPVADPSTPAPAAPVPPTGSGSPAAVAPVTPAFTG